RGGRLEGLPDPYHPGQESAQEWRDYGFRSTRDRGHHPGRDRDPWRREARDPRAWRLLPGGRWHPAGRRRAPSLSDRLMPTRAEAIALLYDWNENPSLRKHGLLVEAGVNGYAIDDGLDNATVEMWGLAGLLHDLDYE